MINAGRNYLLISICCVGVHACRPATEDFIVKVGNRVLSSAMLDSALLGDLRNQETVREAYIQDWIQSEAIYQKAVSMKYNEDPNFEFQLERIKKELLIQAFLEKELEKSLSVSQPEVEQYYETHESEFQTLSDHVKTEYYLTRNKNRAKKLETQFSKMSRIGKKDFLEVVTQAASDSDVVGQTDFWTRDQFEERVAKYVFAKSATDEILGPILMADSNYSLWHVVEIRPKGTPTPLASIQAEIEARIKAVKRKQKMDELVKKIKTETSIEYSAAMKNP